MDQKCGQYHKPVDNPLDVAIGIKEAPSAMQKPDRHYAMICECPECESQFWFHTLDDMAEFWKEKYLEGKFKRKQPK